MNYPEIFNKAWKLVWKHKALWLFALFAGSLVGVGFGMPGSHPRSGMQYQFSGNDWSNQMPPFLQGRIPQLWQDARSANPLFWVWLVVAMIMLALVLTAISLFLSTAGRGGLIKGLLMAEDKFDDQPVSFKEVWKAMKPYFWKLLLLRLFLGIAAAILSLILVVLFVIVTIGTLGLILCLLIPLALLAIPMCMLLNAVIANASIALIDEDLDIFKAITRSWQIVTGNIWSYLLLIFFNFLISIGAALAMLLPFVLVSTPFFLTGLFGGELSTAAWVVLGILLFFALVVAIFVGMWVNTLQHGIFVIAYRRLKFQVTTPFSRQEMPTPPVAPSEETSIPSIETDTNLEAEARVNSGNEPASNPSNEVSEKG